MHTVEQALKEQLIQKGKSIHYPPVQVESLVKFPELLSKRVLQHPPQQTKKLGTCPRDPKLI